MSQFLVSLFESVSIFRYLILTLVDLEDCGLCSTFCCIFSLSFSGVRLRLEGDSDAGVRFNGFLGLG